MNHTSTFIKKIAHLPRKNPKMFFAGILCFSALIYCIATGPTGLRLATNKMAQAAKETTLLVADNLGFGASRQQRWNQTINATEKTWVEAAGIQINTPSPLGSTNFSLSKRPVRVADQRPSIRKVVGIHPEHNEDLGAGLVFAYTDAELGGLDESKLILYSSLDNGQTWDAHPNSRVDIKANTITLDGIRHFSLWTAAMAPPPPDPGCITGARLWLKADEGAFFTGMTEATQGQKVNTWKNWGTGAANAIPNSASQIPLLTDGAQASAINYNPVINTNGKYFKIPGGMVGANTFTNANVFVVSRTNGATNGSVLNERGSTYVNNHIPWGNGVVYWDAGNAGALRLTTAYTGSGGAYATPYLWSLTANGSGTSNQAIIRNGTQLAVKNSNVSYTGKVSNTAYVGAAPGSGYYNGDIAEVMYFPTNISVGDRHKIESYLAVKYGITLSHDYVASNGTTIWDIAGSGGFNWNIAGIGRDNCSALYQKQSRSANPNQFVTIATGASIATSNAGNMGTIAADNSFLLWGDNNGSQTTSVAVSGVNVTDRMARVWRVDKSNWTDQNITFKAQGFGNRYLIIHNTSATFATAPNQEILLDATGTATFNSSLLPDGAYFSIGKLIQGPGCVNSGLGAWWRADNEAYATNWTDFSGNGYNMHNVGAPVFQTTGANFNPLLRFNNNYFQYNTGIFKNSPGALNMKVFSVVLPVNGQYNAPWGERLSNGYNVAQYAPYTNNITYFDAPYGYRVQTSYTGLGGSYGVPNLVMGERTPSNLGIRVNGKAFNKPGSYTGIYVANTAANYVGAQPGRSSTGNSGVAEVVVYRDASALTATDVQKIESYLAFKYGITLDQTAPRDYLAANGTTKMWDAVANAAYKFNIAGLGRDDCQLLNQKQSKSVNAAQFITFAVGNAIAASNAANTGSITTDNSYFVWGDNNGSKNTVVAVSGVNVNERMTRVWRVDKTNWTDQNITIQVQGYGSRYFLIHNTDPAFGTAPTQEILLDPKGRATFSSSLLPDGAYFTLGNVLQGPGCVNTGIASWFDASEMPVGPMVEGVGWTDVSGWDRNMYNIGAGRDPDVQESMINFNRGAFFDGNDVVFQPSYGKNFTAGEVFSVGQANDIANRGPMFDFGGTPTGQGAHHYPWGNAATYDGFGTNDRVGYVPTTNAIVDGAPGLTVTGAAYSMTNWNIYNIGAATNDWFSGFNGLAKAVRTTNTPIFQTSSNNANGNQHIGWRDGYYFYGKIAEVVHYNRKLTPVERQRVHSYLGLKYGLTLDQTSPYNYVATDGSVYWDATANSAFKFNIAGIGRDNCTKLDQKQSRSSNAGQFITMSLGSTIAASNNDNANTITNDKSFLVWGDNNGSKTTSVAVPAVNVTTRMTRVWRVDKTNWGDQPITFRAQGYANRYLLIHNTSATFATAPSQEIELDENGMATFNSSLLPDGAYFTIGAAIKGPGCVDVGVGSWWRADVGASGTAWSDYSGNDFDINAVGAPAFNTTGANFNPFVKFNGNYYTYPSGIFKNTPGALNMKVFTVVVPVNGYLTGPWGERLSNGYNVGLWAPHSNNNVYFDAPYGHRVLRSFSTMNGQYNVPNIIAGEKTPTNMAIRLNGLVYNQPGSYPGNYMANTTANHLGAQPGNASGGNTGVAEVIVYRDATAMTATDVQKIESYLALKYGITLDQTTARDYLASNGTTKMWDATVNAAFKYNIAGIGRDNCQGLHQKQSKSVNPGQFITIATGPNIFNSSAEDSVKVINDRSFLVWGDNNGVLTNVVAVNGANVTERSARVWRVDKTNWADQPITFKAQGFANRYLLIHNTDPAFGTAPTQEIELDETGKATFNSSLLPDGAYFTLGNAILGPGCVNVGVKYWLKSDYGAATNWDDYSGNDNTAIAQGAPTLTGLINFNPAYQYNNNAHNLPATSDLVGNYSMFGMAQITGTAGRVFESQVGNALFGYHGGKENQLYVDANPNLLSGIAVTKNVNLFSLQRSSSGAWEFRGEGKTIYSGAASANSTWRLDIGGKLYFNEPSQVLVPEVVGYNRDLTAAEVQRVESYFALKYGFTLDQTVPQDYLAGDGVTKMWDATVNAGFKYNIAGLGRDKCDQLHQKQSMSTNPGQFITIALGGVIETDMASNTYSITNDKSFLVWGDNNGSRSTTVAVTASNVTERLSRVWRVDKTNWADQDITFRATGYPNRYLLIHNTSATFATAPDQEILLDETGQATFSSAALPDGAYFTIGDAIKGPGCVNTGVKAWLKTEFGVSTTGALVNTWADYSGNDANVGAAVGAEPTLLNASAVNFNFYKGVEFTGNKVMSFELPGTVVHNNLTIFAAGIPTGTGTWNTMFRASTNDHPIIVQGGTAAFGYFNNTGPGFQSSGIVASTTVPSIFGMQHNAATNTAQTFLNGKAGTTLTGIDETNKNAQFFGNYQGGGQPFGKIAEVVLYNGTPTAIERQRINSYFALKYGITLDQTVATDYLSADGMVKMWDATVNAAHKFNIAGLGRDNCQALHQKQSRSANTGQFITIALGNSIEADNAENTASVSNDKSFLVWGDNNGSLSAAVPVSGANVTERMSRVWRVDKTNWDDQEITFRASLYPNRYLLIHNTSATFATAPDQEILLDASGKATFNSSLLPDGAYFTIGDALKGPGCVNLGVKAWLRADFEATSALWSDYSGNGNDAVGAGAPALSGLINFNPAFQYGSPNAHNLPSTADVVANYSIFGLAKITGTSQRVFQSQVGNALFGYWGNKENVVHLDGNPSLLTGVASTQNTNLFSIHRNSTGAWKFRGKGETINSAATSANSTWRLNIGGTSALNEPSQVLVPEVVVFNRELTAAEVQRVESYFAIKYGLTLSQTTAQDYLAGDGVTKIWNAAANGSYKHDIAGIGRDNCQGLYQKQSKSANSDALVTMGNGNTIAASNAANTSMIETDKSFMVWANNDGAITWQLTEAPDDRLRLGREWRVSETGAIGSVLFSVPDNSSSMSSKMPAEATTLYLLVDDDGDFSTDAIEFPLVLNGTNWEAEIDFTDGQYFTIATQVPPAPGCVVSGLQVWLKADAGTSSSTNLDPLTDWFDQTVNSRDHAQTNASYQPKFKTNAFNFNPAVSFDGTDAMVTNTFASGNEAVHVFVMSKVNDNGWRSLYGFSRDATHVQWYNNGAANRPSVWLAANQIPSTALGIDYGVTSFILPKDGSQKTIHWNGTSGNIAGINTYSYSANKMAVGSDISVDGLALSENFLGDIAEVVIYKTGTPSTNGGRMATLDIEKIESYLAFKYGVTLSHDYYSGTGATIWDVGGSGGFDFNIAGIGRDDCQLLLQKQSKSINAGQFITFSLGASIADDNVSNTSTIANDGSFFVWGDDNGSKNNVVPVAGTNVTERMVRKWRVDKTNWADQQITFRAQGYANRYLLISNTSATFATIDQEIQLDANGEAMFNSDVLPDGAYFTIGDAVKGPGCVNSGVKVWLRADQGNVTSTLWPDFSGQDNNPIGRGSATITAGAVNFNPAVTFAGTATGEAYDFSSDLFTTGNHSLTVFSVGTGNGGTILSHGANATDQAIYVRPSTPTATFDFPSRAFSRASIPTGARLMRNSYKAATKERGISFNGNAPTTNTVATLNWQSGGNGYRIIGHDFVTGANKYAGNLPEMAVYFDIDLTPVEIQRIESYFALKYGITLDQTIPQDYLSGDGVVKMWDATVNLGFGNNIAGMGRDNCQPLHQKQSKSSNPGQFVTFAIGSSIASDNAGNLENVTNDKSFLVWGDNNGSLTSSIAVSGANVTQRMARIWRVDKTNWNDQDITVKVEGYPNRYLIVHNTSATFATAPNQEIPLDANGLATFNSSLIPDGAYFSIGDAIKGPGCVNLGVKLWLRADYDAAPNQWLDYSGNDKDATQTTMANQPSLSSGSLNFNPALVFDNTNDNMTIANSLIADFPTGNSSRTAFTVARLNTNTGQDFVFGYGSNAANQSFEMGNNAGRAWYENWGSGYMGVVGAYPANRTIINTWHHNNAMNPSSNGYIDGKTDWPQNVTLNTVLGTNPLYIGRHNDNGTPRYMDGEIAEVVLYDRALTANEMQRVNSYLALKYGVTLDQTVATDYLAGDGVTKIWDAALNAGYNHDIAGIGRDNCQALHQKQSRSVNADGLITIGHGNTIAADNASNTNAITADKSFMVWGNNDGAIAWQLTEVPAANRMRITREWRVQETGTVGSVKVRVPDNSSPLSVKMPPEAYPVYLLIDEDGDFSSGATEISMTLNGTDWEAEYDLQNGYYFTFSTEVPPAPGCVVPSLGLWLEANKGVTGNPTVTAWEDQTLNLSPITVVGAPQITSSINFNPAIALGTGKYFTTPNAAFLNPTSSKLTVFAVTKPTSAATNPIISKTTSSAWPDGYGLYGNANQKVGFWEGAKTGVEPANVPHQVYPSATPFIATGYYDTNQKVSVNGQTAVSATQTPTTSASQVEIGYAKTLQFTGDYAEVIMYHDDIGAAAREKVESYLAVKYGITLAHDYYAGNGTKVWDVGATGGYDNNITGIGRDDCDQLNQKQSKSVASGSLVTVGHGNTIETSNDANTNDFEEDVSFMLWGNNNGGIFWQAAEAPVGRRRLTREWLVSEIGTVGSVKVQVPDNSSSLATRLPAEVSTVYLLVDADGDFSSGATEIEMTLNGTDWEANVNFTNGQYFTFATNQAPQPGCIGAGISVWLKADLGFTPASWADQSGNLNDATQGTGTNQPALAGASNYINFNPAVDFDGANDIMQIPAAALGTNTTQYTIFSVVNADANGSVLVQELNACSNAAVNPQFSADGNLNWHSSTCVGSPAAIGGGLVTTRTVLNGADRNMSTGVGSTWRDGLATGTITRDINTAASEELWLGGRVDGAPDNFNGRIAEIALYSIQLSASERQRVESYLALKYGITLSHDYFNGAGNVIWDVGNTGGYDNDIAAIGREDCAALSQKQSKSGNADALVTIGNGNSIAVDNPSNTSTFAADASYMIWGNNDGAIAWQDTETPAQRQRLTREWLIAESNSVGSVKIRIPDNSSSLSTKLPAEVLSVFLLVDNDGDFSSGAVEVPMSLNGTNWEVDHDFVNGEYFTFATETCAPIITTNPVDVTLCAGGNATFTVAALGPNLTYQWQENTGSGFVNIPGATSDSFTKMSVTGTMNGYQYQAIVNGVCMPAATSTIATMTVNTPPAITTQPVAVTVCAGQNATFSVVATGTGLTYQWQENTGSGFVNIPGATSDTYTKSSVTFSMNGYQYQVVVSGTCAPPATSAAVALSVNQSPAITTQPDAVTVCAGANATFSVVATGAGLTYQWQENAGSGFANIPGATGTSYTKMATTGSMDGYLYQCVITGTCAPPVLSNSAPLTVHTPPVITTQPSASTVCEGSDATFTVAATGTGLTYQWQENTGSGFNNIPGATAASYTKLSTTSSMSGYQYQVVITGTCTPAATSAPVTLTVNTAPAITAQPSAATVCEGQNATFTVTATGTGLAYQWQENTGSGFVNIPGATNASYTKMSTTSTMSGYQYQVIVSGTCPSPVTSTPVALTVNTLPAITTQPTAVTVCAGADATFTVAATGTGLMYQWQENTGSGFANIPGATSASYTKSSTTSAMNGYMYQVIVSGTCTPPVTSAAVALTVNTAPGITAQPMPATVCAGQDATFTVTATGSNLSYQWQEDTGTGFVNIPGATNASYTKASTTLAMDGYEYQVIITGICPVPVTSSAVALTVNSVPAITTQPTAVTVCEGADATFTVAATGTGLMYQWQENTGMGFVNISGATNASYTKSSTTSAMSGYLYQVIVSGTCTPPVTSAAVALTVNTAPGITSQPMSATVCVGQDATFTVVATGTGLTYQWQEDTGTGFVNIPGATSASYTKASTTLAMNAYQYQVVIAGICPVPVTSSAATLTVNSLPSITTQPTAVTVCAGSDATFSVTATGTGLMYQWQENTGSGFVNISGATNASYTKTSTTVAMSGYQYQVIVSGACMPPVTSAAVALTVNAAPAITAQPMAATVCEGMNATYSVLATGTGITYQWQEDSGSGFVNIPGATSASYTRTAATFAMNGNMFQVIVSGICPAPVTSTPVSLTVNTLPAIAGHPASITVCEGDNATFNVTASGTGLMYQWQENTGSGYLNISGATNASYTLAGTIALMNGYQYRVIVSGTCAPPVTSNAAVLTVNTAPSITTQPSSTAACAGNDATFTVVASGAGVTYQWQENTGSGFANIPGATAASYTKPSTTVSMNGYQYRVLVNGLCPPSLTSNIATLTVNALPAITTQPNNVTTCAGNNAIFTVSATGSGVTYQWQENTGSGFVNITGATGSLFIKSSVTSAMNGYQYRVIVGGTCPPTVTSNMVTLTVNTAPAITVQPSSVIVCETSNATFSVTATGTGLTYQWQENTGSGFANIPGATSASYTKSGVTSSMDGYQYQVIVNGACAPSVTSNPAMLTVTTAPAITMQPNNVDICAGANAVFSVSTTGAGLAYQWQVNDGFGFVDIPGANNPTYTKVAAPSSYNGYQYRVIVGGVCPPSVTSNIATLTITPAPSIVSQPSSLTACVGSSATFSMVAIGPGLSYQWQENTGSGFVNISGANSDSYTKMGITGGMNGYQYRVLVSGTCAPTAVSNPAIMSVEAPPSITTQPVGTAVCEGGNATFSVAATGTGLSYQWQENTGSGFVNIPGATNATYTKASVLGSMNGYQYKVIVTGACSPPATSNAATMTVNAAPAVSTHPADQTVCDGGNAIFNVTATGAGLTYQWQMNTGSGFTNIAGATNPAYTEAGVNPAMDGRQYRVIVSGTCTPPATSNAAFLTVNTPPAITIQPAASTTCSGSNATFSVTATGSGLMYQWQENTGSGFVNIPGATSATYVKSAVTTAMNGYTYRVNISGACPPAITSSTVGLTVIEAPVVTSHPMAVTLCAGGNATFNVNATGAGLTYQWQENTGSGFMDIAGATNPSFTKPSTTSTMNGYQYRVVVSGTCAPPATSNNALLTVNTAPAITTQPSATTVCAGASASFSVTATGTGLNYQWQENDGSGFVNIPGETSASYTIAATTSAMNGYLYQVIVSGTCNPAVTSTPVALTVNNAPAISTQPSSTTVCAGADATFTVVSTGTGLTYQWQENDGSGFADISGATNASYTKTATTGAMNTYQYRVIVSGTCTPAVTSNAAVLTVNLAPAITAQPMASTVCAGADATFSVSATGTGLTYQWQVDSGSGFANISGATGTAYTAVSTTTAMNGNLYQVIVSGTCTPPATSTPVALTVNAAPSISMQPMSVTADEGTNATFSVTAAGAGLTYQWQENNGSGFVNIPGATGTSYTKMTVTYAMNTYQYRVIVSGTCSPAATSSNAILTVNLISPVLAVKAFLGGAYEDGPQKMHDKLRVKNLIPNAQPFNGSQYSDFAYNGTETIGAGVLAVTGDNAIVDWVMLELRDAANPATIVARKAALIQRDGDVVSAADGTSSVTFTGTSAGTYYVAIRHRNHLGVMTQGSLSLSGTVTTIDFTLASTQNYQLSGANGSPHTQQVLNNGKRALWSGNFSNTSNTGNRIINQGNDADPDETYFRVLLDPGNTNVVPNYIVLAYDRSDGNLDGNVIYQGGDSDADIPFYTVFLFPGNVLSLPNFIVYQQIP